MVKVKTITMRLDYPTWEKYEEVKKKAGMTWDSVLVDWFEREERGEFK